MNSPLNQVLRLNKVLKLANPDTPQHRFKSAIKPGAHYTTLCAARDAYEIHKKKILRIIDPESQVHTLLKAVIELMFLNGLRISEVLKISGKDISTIGNIHIKGSKGSKDRYAVTGIYKKYWIALRSTTCQIGEDYSRFYFYREFKKLGLILQSGQNSNASVTHSFRHLLVTTNQQQHNQLELSQTQLGHKSIKSTKHYDNKKTSSRRTKTK